MLLHAFPYNYNFPHTCQIYDRSQLVNSLTELYNSNLPQMEILSVRLPPVLICSPPTINDAALIAIARLQLMIDDALKPQSCLSAVIGGIHWEVDSGMEFTRVVLIGIVVLIRNYPQNLYPWKAEEGSRIEQREEASCDAGHCAFWPT